MASLQKKNSTTNERSTCMGTFADIISGMKGAVQPYVADLYELLMKGLADPEAEVCVHFAMMVRWFCV